MKEILYYVILGVLLLGIGYEDFKTHKLKNKHMLYFFILRFLLYPLKPLSLDTILYSIGFMFLITLIHTLFKYKSGGDIKLWGALILWLGFREFFTYYALSMGMLFIATVLAYLGKDGKIKAYFYGEIPVGPFVFISYLIILIMNYSLHIDFDIINLIL